MSLRPNDISPSHFPFLLLEPCTESPSGTPSAQLRWPLPKCAFDFILIFSHLRSSTVPYNVERCSQLTRCYSLICDSEGRYVPASYFLCLSLSHGSLFSPVQSCAHSDAHDTSRSAASEVSSILESRIAGTSVGANVEETGRVLSECDALEFMVGGVAE